MAGLIDSLTATISSLRERRDALVRDHGEYVVDRVTLAQLYGGLRGVKGLVTETSVLDPVEGIRFRGHTIPELKQLLPRAAGGREPLPEAMFHLLLTGELPSDDEVRELSAEWRRRERMPAHVAATLDGLPVDAHPMTQLSVGVVAMQTESVFARRYREGADRHALWIHAFEDAMNLLASIPLIAAYVYRRSFKHGRHIPPGPPELDWAANFAHMLGYDDRGFIELMRLYLCLLSDHEGGNVSAHTVHLVGSALSDPYLAFGAGMNGLAGPLHGLANQESLRWILELQEELGGGVPSEEAIEAYVWQTLQAGRVVPGFGHAVLRRTDPRYMAQREFALHAMPEDQLFRIVDALYRVVPRILERHGRAKNPWPNVDAHTGVLFLHYGMTEYDFYTVLFGVSRAIGTLASFVLDRALGQPLERPKSVSTDWVDRQVRQSTVLGS
jgi:citrate synthase